MVPSRHANPALSVRANARVMRGVVREAERRSRFPGRGREWRLAAAVHEPAAAFVETRAPRRTRR